MKNLVTINNFLARIFFYLLLVLVFINIIGIIYQFKQVSDFMDQHPDGRNNLGIFLAGWAIAEVYLLFMVFVAWGIRQIRKWQWFKLFLLILIFGIAIAPGVYFVVGVFLKK